MNKSSLFIAAGAAVLLCGCPPTRTITGPRPVVPAMEDPTPVEVAEPALQPEENPVAKPQPAQAPVFKPLTGAVSSGGVDSSAPRSRSKQIRNAGKVVAPGGTYIVQPGDSIERIARKHGVRWTALLSANNLDQKSARRLQIGQKLTIPGRDAKAAAVTKKSGKKAVANTAPAAAPAADADGKYVVKSGDTPERIARKHRVRLSDLLKANNLDQQSARSLQIGQKLIIPGRTAAPAKVGEPTVTQDPVQPTVTPVVQPAVDNTPIPVEPPVVENAPVTVEQPTVVTEPAVSGQPTDNGDTESEVGMVQVEENATAAELAAKYNVSAEAISQKNSGKTEFTKGDLIFVPKN